jgi:hypothetical protein
MRSFIICTPPQISLADQIKENEVDGTCGTHGRGEISVQGFGGKARRKENSEDQGIGGRMGSEWILGRLAGGVKSGYSWLRIGAGGGLFVIR